MQGDSAFDEYDPTEDSAFSQNIKMKQLEEFDRELDGDCLRMEEFKPFEDSESACMRF